MSKFYCDSSTGRIHEVFVVGVDGPDAEIHDIELSPRQAYHVPTRLLGDTREQARVQALKDLEGVLRERERQQEILEADIAHFRRLIEDGSPALLRNVEDLVSAAALHGRSGHAGDEVMDLQGLLRLAWERLNDYQKADFVRDPRVITIHRTAYGAI